MRPQRTVTLLAVAVALLLGALVGSWAWAMTPTRASTPAAALGTGFAYQGQLRDGGQPADGSYGFTFTLYDALSGGAQVGSPLSRPAVAVSQGFFAVELDFGSVFDGSARYLEIAVKPTGAGDAPTTLSPRQSLAPVPYALRAAAAPQVQVWRWFNTSGIIDPGTGDINIGTGIGNETRSRLGTPRIPAAVKSVHLRIYSRGISSASYDKNPYNGAALLKLEIKKTADGTIVQQIDLQTDMMTAGLNTWITLPIPASLTIADDEMLMGVITGDGTTGSVEIRFDLEVEVQQ